MPEKLGPSVPDVAALVQRSPPAPLLVPAVAFAAGIAIADGAAANIALPAWALISVGGATWLAVMLGRKSRPALATIVEVAAGLICLLAGYGRQIAERPPPHHIVHAATYAGTLTRLTCRVVSAPLTRAPERRNPFLAADPPASTRFLVEVLAVDTTHPPTPATGLMRVSVDGGPLALEPGDVVTLTGRLFRIRPPATPGETDWARVMARQGILAGLSLEGPQYVRVGGAAAAQSGGAPANGYLRLVNRGRALARRAMLECETLAEDEQARSLLDGIVLGQRSAISRSLNDAFTRTGAVHILSVSGFHVGVVAAAGWFLLRRVAGLRRRPTAVIVVLLLLAYVVLAEQNAPIVRSAVMAVIICLAQLRRRPVSALNSVCLAGVLILLWNPQNLFQAGFQLSFTQVIALITLAGPLVRRLNARLTGETIVEPEQSPPRWLRRRAAFVLIASATASVVAWAVSVPLSALHFGRVAPLGALQSLLILPLASMVILVGFATLLAGLVAEWAGAALGHALHGLTDLLILLVDWLARIPLTSIEIHPPPALLVAATYLLPLVAHALVRLWRRAAYRDVSEAPIRRGRHVISAATAAAVLLSWSAWAAAQARPARECSLNVLAVGNGNAAFLVVPGGDALVFDAGTTFNSDAGATVARALHARGARRIASAFVSHADMDHYGGVPTLLGHYPHTRVLTCPDFFDSIESEAGLRHLREMLPDAADRFETLAAHDAVQLDESLTRAGAALEVLWPPREMRRLLSDNDSSLVLRLSVAGQSVLLPGDIQHAAIDGLLQAEQAGRIRLKTAILIAPHHGSVTATNTRAFYRAVDPDVVIASTSREIDRLRDVVGSVCRPGTRVISTGESGSVGVRFRNGAAPAIETPFRTK
ncbi:MAG: hypothetical protein CHACPFDD_00287 [Phycisphaerae bacterium]|nr:hypothetical protein [Phycisphaerae bacterium]